MPTPKPRPSLALPALLIANFVLACGPWFVRLARVDGGVGPVAAGFWRLTLTLPLLLIAAWRIERPVLTARPATMVVIGGVAFAVDLALWHIGILHTRLANSTLLGNLAALTFPLYGFWLIREWPKARQWTALLLAALGAVLLVGRSASLSPENFIGDLACLGAGVAYTVYLIAIDRSSGRVPPITTLAICGLAGAPLLALASKAAGETLWPHDWSALIALSIGSQVIGQGLMLYGVARTAPIVVGLMLLSQPVIAAAMGWTLYGERLSLLDAIGAVAIGIAVLLVRDARKPETLPPAEGGVGSPA